MKVRKLGAGQGGPWEGKEGAREEGQALNSRPPESLLCPPGLWLELSRAQPGGCYSTHGAPWCKKRCLFLKTSYFHQSQMCHDIPILLKQDAFQPSVRTQWDQAP